MRKPELRAEMEEYFRQPTVTVEGSPEFMPTWVYRLCDSKVYVRELVVDSGLPGEPIVLTAMGDMHLNCLNEEDEQNEELLETRKHRFWNANSASVPAVKRGMEFAKFFDQTVIVGDTLDFLSKGSMDLVEELIWNVDPDALIALGGHDVVRQMQTGKKDQTSLESRYEIVKNFWHHDVYYVSRVIGEKVMLILLDNGQGRYWPQQVEPLRRDLALAKEKNLPVLIFQHEPLCSRNPAENPLDDFRKNFKDNKAFLYTKYIGSGEMDEPTREIYEMITTQQDLIRAVICGHRHGEFYSEILASCTDAEGNRTPAILPQYILMPNCYNDYSGNVLKITVR